MNKTVKQNVIIAVLAVATLFFTFLSVLAVIPSNTEIEIREEIKVSSSLVDVEKGEYRVFFDGALRNTTGQEITVEKLVVPADGRDRSVDGVEIVVENVTIPARATVQVSASTVSLENCSKTGEVVATYQGQDTYLRNPAAIDPVAVLIPIAITAVFAICLVRACKVRVYMEQEKQIKV